MRRRLIRKLGSLIGLLAILMTTLAPAVSQALASRARTTAILSAHCSAIKNIQAHAADHPPSHHSNLGHLGACGYCSFTAHSPTAPSSVHALPAHLAAVTLVVNASVQSAAPHAPSFAAQPRAPPAFV